MNLRAAVILAGCGHRDGSEIREAVITLLELDKNSVNVECFAPNLEQFQVVDHVTKNAIVEKRNIIVESARIARGEVKDLNELNVQNFDMLLIPGGYGVAQNFSNIFKNDGEIEVIPKLKNVIVDFYNAKKPIGAICIAPAIVVAALRDLEKIEVTIGEDKEGLIEKLGGKHVECSTNQSVFDGNNMVFSCSAYMRNDSLFQIYRGIKRMIKSMITFLNKKNNLG